jgi:hypothetical protein
MEPAALIAFAGLCLYACTRPAVALAVVTLMFPLEIVLQALSPMLRNSGLGLKAVNIAVGSTALLAVVGVVVKNPGRVSDLARPMPMVTYAMFAWSAVTLLWSPGAESGLESIVGQLPYLVVTLILAPLLLRSIDDYGDTVSASIVIVGGLCAIVVVSPEFVVKDSRLGFELGVATRSNPLALGEMGGLGIILGVLARNSTLGAWAVPLRLAAILLGAAVAIQSGSRGQFFYALAIALVFLPLAAPIANFKNFALTVGFVAFVVVGSYVLLGSLLFGVAEKRFSIEGLLYGSSSSQTRIENVLSLASAWAGRPFAWVAGLGFYAFNGLFADSGNIYSHVLFADMIFEEGIPGTLLFTAFVFMATRACFTLFNGVSQVAIPRSSAAVLIGLYAYQTLLVNKQGNLWGSTYYFLYGLLLVEFSRLETSERSTSALDGQFASS